MFTHNASHSATLLDLEQDQEAARQSKLVEISSSDTVESPVQYQSSIGGNLSNLECAMIHHSTVVAIPFLLSMRQLSNLTA
jgi:hypothetical protein